MAMKGVQFLMWSRIHGAEELIDEANFRPILEWDLVRCGHWEEVENLEAMGRHQGMSNAHLERKVTYQLFHMSPSCPHPS